MDVIDFRIFDLASIQFCGSEAESVIQILDYLFLYKLTCKIDIDFTMEKDLISHVFESKLSTNFGRHFCLL